MSRNYTFMKKRLLIFHPTIAPYRIDFFNDFSKAFDTRVCLRYRNLRSQTFDYNKIAAQFAFEPIYQDSSVKGYSREFYWSNLDEFNPNVVIVEEFSLGAVYVLLHRFIKRRKYKVISICDDSYNMVAENNDFSKAHKFARKIVVPQLDGMILVEPKVTEWYKIHYGKGFCFPIIKPDDKARNEYERVLPLSNKVVEETGIKGKRVFLFVGRLVALKNVDTVMRAFSRLNQEENVFVVVGDGPEREKLETLAVEQNANVLFTGRLEGDALNSWYNIASVFVLASYQEAFGAVTNEALLAGCYVLISNKAGSSCLVEEGVNGYTFSPMDVEELAQKMDTISSKITQQNSRIVLKSNMMRVSFGGKMKELIDYISCI